MNAKNHLPELNPGDGVFTSYHYDVLAWIYSTPDKGLWTRDIEARAKERYPAWGGKTTWRTALAKLRKAGYISGDGDAPRRLTAQGNLVAMNFDSSDFPRPQSAVAKPRYAAKWRKELKRELPLHPEGLTEEQLRAMPMGSKGGPTIQRAIAEGWAAWDNGRLKPVHYRKRSKSLFG